MKNVDFDYNYPDFYDEKNYEYIDGVDVDKIQLQLESNRKISDDGEEIQFNFKPLDYDSYEFDDVGILNFNKPPTKSLSQKKISKRRFRPIGGDLFFSCSTQSDQLEARDSHIAGLRVNHSES